MTLTRWQRVGEQDCDRVSLGLVPRLLVAVENNGELISFSLKTITNAFRLLPLLLFLFSLLLT